VAEPLCPLKMEHETSRWDTTGIVKIKGGSGGAVNLTEYERRGREDRLSRRCGKKTENQLGGKEERVCLENDVKKKKKKRKSTP